MARRDLRRHKGHAVLVALMVGIPMIILSLVMTLGGGLGLTRATPESAMGAATAIVTGPMEDQILQTGSDQNVAYRSVDPNADPSNAPALPIPGYDAEQTPSDNAAAIGALTGGTATPVTERHVRVKIGDRRVLMESLALDGNAADFGAKLELLTGRWPTGTDEALVSAPGIRNGLPDSGTFDLVTPDGTRPVTVVGTATGTDRWGKIPHLFSAEPLVPSSINEHWVGEWLITGTDMPFSKVTDLGQYGLQVQSAELIKDPVPKAELPPELAMNPEPTYDPDLAAWLLAAGIIVAIVITLLVAPAFAVSAARRRHTLALAASNGATTRQLRRTVLAQALLLGALAAVLGSLIGVGAAAGFMWWRSRTSTEVYVPVVTIPWLGIVVLTLVAILASFTAALIPSRRLDRLDIMGVIKGQSVSPQPSRVLPLAGSRSWVRERSASSTARGNLPTARPRSPSAPPPSSSAPCSWCPWC